MSQQVPLTLESLRRLRKELQDCIDGGYGNARTPIDWFHVGPLLIDAAEENLRMKLLGEDIKQRQIRRARRRVAGRMESQK